MPGFGQYTPGLTWKHVGWQVRGGVEWGGGGKQQKNHEDNVQSSYKSNKYQLQSQTIGLKRHLTNINIRVNFRSIPPVWCLPWGLLTLQGQQSSLYKTTLITQLIMSDNGTVHGQCMGVQLLAGAIKQNRPSMTISLLSKFSHN